MDSFLQANSTQCFFSPASYVFTCIFDISSAVLGLPLVLHHFWVALSTSPKDILNLNISIFNTVQCLFHLVDVILFACLKNYYTQARFIMLWFCITGGPLLMCIICVERYIAVVWPRLYPLLKTYRFREVCSAVSWATSLFFTLAMSCAIHLKLPSLSFYVYSIATVVFGMSCCATIMCNIKILHTLKNSGPSRDKRHPMKVKALRTVGRITVIILCCYIPSSVLLKFLSHQGTSQCIIIPICLGLILTASIFYSFLTLHSKGELYNCLKKIPAGTM